MGRSPFVVEGRVRVQQQQRHPPHLDQPDRDVDRASGQLHGHRQRLTELVRDALDAAGAETSRSGYACSW